MTQYQGSCHCGAVKFSFAAEPIESGLRCTCSMCVRKGAVMINQFIPEDKLKINAQDDALSMYQFGKKTARHLFCKHCGIYPFHETARKPGHYRINLGCVESIDPLSLPVEVFDGKNLL